VAALATRLPVVPRRGLQLVTIVGWRVTFLVTAPPKQKQSHAIGAARRGIFLAIVLTQLEVEVVEATAEEAPEPSAINVDKLVTLLAVALQEEEAVTVEEEVVVVVVVERLAAVLSAIRPATTAEVLDI